MSSTTSAFTFHLRIFQHFIMLLRWFTCDFIQCGYELVYVRFRIKKSWADSDGTVWKSAKLLMRKGGAMKTGTHCNIKGLVENGADFCWFKSLYIYGEDTDFLEISVVPYKMNRWSSFKAFISLSVKFCSCFLIVWIPFDRTYSIPALSPTIPTVLGVPLSSLKGSSSGWDNESGSKPVPPSLHGSKVTRSPTYSPPVPVGPSGPLCPVKASMSI